MNPDSCNRRVTALRLTLILAAGLAVVFSACGFILSETESGIVLRFGKPVRVIEKSGFYFRLPPPVERVVRVDRRLQHAEIRISETLTKDQRNVIVPVYFTWRVSDPLLFHTAVHDVENARLKLDALVTSSRNSVLGRHDFGDLVAEEDKGASLPEIENEMLDLSADDASQHLGIELLATGVTRIQLPEANTESVFRRMRAERKREATQYRAEGRAQATEMKAETDKEATGMIAEAKRKAEEIRGQAEAEASSIYAQAHGQDPAFYRFLRELQSLRTVVDKNTTVVLDTGVAPFQWLKSVETEAAPPVSEPPVPKPPVKPDNVASSGNAPLPMLIEPARQ